MKRPKRGGRALALVGAAAAAACMYCLAMLEAARRASSPSSPSPAQALLAVAPPRLTAAAVAAAAALALRQSPTAPLRPAYCPEGSQWASVIIVTAETRSLPANASMDSFLSVMAVNQHAWAAERGYPLLRFVYPPMGKLSRTCFHPLHGARHASWCKLLAVRMAALCVPATALVFWMDSDSTATRMSADVRALIEAAPTGRISHKTCYRDECMRFKHRACLLTTANFPSETENAMASMFFLTADACGLAALRAWWNIGICADEFPWEQRALNSVLYPASYHNASDVRISQMAYGPNHYNDSEPFVHFGHTFSSRDRLNLTQHAMRRLFSGRAPSNDEFAQWHAVARASEVPLTPEALNATSAELCSGGDGWHVAQWLDEARRKMFLARECFWAIFIPKVP